ncbi:hypothetical protein ACOSQ2_010315 [Xanthoceras sorbifolium]
MASVSFSCDDDKTIKSLKPWLFKLLQHIMTAEAKIDINSTGREVNDLLEAHAPSSLFHPYMFIVFVQTRTSRRSSGYKTLFLLVKAIYFKTNDETINYLFLHCHVASNLWARLCKELKIVWAARTHAMLFSWKIVLLFVHGKKGKVSWRCVVMSLLWVIWQEVNNQIF